MQENDFSEKIALYFYFSYLDELKAQASTIRTLKKVSQDLVEHKRSRDSFGLNDLVRITAEGSGRRERAVKATHLAFSTGHIVLPENSNWGPWFEFRKLANDKDFSAVLYSKVLSIPEEEIAKGLSLPLGTVRYRIGRGLKLLGRICQHGGDSARR